MEPQLENPPLRQLENSDKIQEYWAVALFGLIILQIVCKCVLLPTQKVLPWTKSAINLG